MIKKVLHIVGDSQFGGGSVLIIRLAQEAANHGYQVDVLSTNSELQQAIRKSGLGVVDLDCIWREIRPFKDFAGLFRLYYFLSKNRYDIVHTHTSKAGLIGRAAAFFARIPVIIHTVHGFAFHEQSSPKAVKFYSFLERLAARWCDKIVTVSQYHRSWALELDICKPKKIVAIPNGIAPERLLPHVERSVFRSRIGISEDDVVLVSAGRLAAQKGIEYLIEAMKILLEQGRFNIKLVLAGDGPLRLALEDKSHRLGLTDRILFLGFRSDVGDILNAGDIAVMPSEREGLSIALLESMALAKPIITTTIGSNLEVTEAGRYAKLVPPKDVQGLTDAIEDFVCDMETANAIGKLAQKHFTNNYTEQKMLDAYLGLYANMKLKQ